MSAAILVLSLILLNTQRKVIRQISKENGNGFNAEIKDGLESFKNEMRDLFLTMICEGINSIKTQIHEIERTNEYLLQENNNLKADLVKLNKSGTMFN